MIRTISLLFLGFFLCVREAKGQNSVSVSKTCFAPSEAIPITFQKSNDSNLKSAWIGIYATSRLASSGNLPAADIWSHLCGNGTCDPNTNPTSGTVTFRSNRNQHWIQSWPLASGTYRAFLTRGDDDDTWPRLAQTVEFRVGTCSVSPPTPVRSPTRAPTLAPGVDMRPVIADARADITDVIIKNPVLRGKFLRLLFHDCVGGCDGCVDMTNPDNAGLQSPIDVLNAFVQKYGSQGLTRPDIWALAAVVASDVSEESAGTVFPFQWIGRKTCANITGGNCGKNFKGESTTCNPNRGPHRALCHADIDGTKTIENFMANAFGFNAQQTTAIMGAHSLGGMRDVNLGFEGRNGWDLTNTLLDRGYFVELIGTSTHPLPAWKQVRRSNSHLTGMPARFQFEATVDGVSLTMLNSDIALVRNLVEGQNLKSDGNVTCAFSGTGACSSDTPFFPFAQTYARSRDTFLADYRDALMLMLENGYTRGGKTCGQDAVCQLTKK